MNIRHQKFSIPGLPGRVLGLAVAGLVLSLAACLPAPVGDPEKSRVDERLNGVWFNGDEGQIWIFRPWDKRTWLLRMTDLEKRELEAPDASEAPAEGEAPAEEDVPGSEEAPGEADETEARDPWAGMTAGSHGLWKIWKTRLGGVDFLTFESAQELTSEKGFQSPAWYVLRMQIENGELTLTHIDYDFEELDVDTVADALENGEMSQRQARRKFETVIARHAKDPAFYGESVGRLVHVPAERYDSVAEAIGLESNF